MAHVSDPQPHPQSGPHADHGARPVLVFLIGALALALAAIAFLGWSGQSRLYGQRVDLNQSQTLGLERPAPAPNPQPLPAP